MGKHKVKSYYDEQGRLIIKPYRLKDLSFIFDISQVTLKRWIADSPEQFNKEGKKYYTVNQVELMVKKFGLPKKVYTGLHPDMNKAA